jgi:putative ABC transport system substrate-binding protein
MKKQLLALSFAAMLFAQYVTTGAQPARKISRVGFLAASGDSTDAGPLVEAFRQGLRDLGYVEGKNIRIEYRYAEGKLDRMANQLTELVQLNVDVIVVQTLIGIRAAKEATKTIPIVIVTAVDPVANGIIDSLARPGGNITGISTISRELSGKRLELLKEAVPRLSRIAVLWDAEGPAAAISFKEYQAVAPALKIALHSLEVRGSTPDLEGAFQVAAKARVGALISIRNSTLNRYMRRIATLAATNRLPSMFEGSPYVEAGGLMSYSSNNADQYRRAATYVDKILKGAKPADLPVEQPTKFEFVINLKTAKQIGLTILQSVLYRADKVIK